ncbi:histidine kinase [Bacteroides sp.]|uniref:sensor histidine kinase n=1 Tax=Bacteroides sp. TaxID=29523 RepID=UPI002613496A|nr:histidine kinase [Bacteroides sp.]
MKLAQIHTDGNTVPDLFISPRFRVLRHILLQLMLMILSINIALNGEGQLYPNPQPEDLISWISHFLLINSTIYFNLYLLAPRYLEKGKYKKYFTGIALTTVFILTGVFLLKGLIFKSSAVEELVRPALILLNLCSSTLAIILMLAGTSTFLLLRHWIGYNQRISELESTTLQSELKQLKRQINPHFLFNMLNNASMLLKKNPEEASQLLFKLEDMLRYQINDSSQDRVSLSSDIHFLNDFLNLEKIRRDKFECSIAKEGCIEHVSLPPLLFIPFVENAVKHNSDSEHGSYVHLSFKVWGNELFFECVNSNPQQSTDNRKQQVGGLGLKNITRRLELLYPDRHTLETEKNENCYKVKLHLIL